MNIPESKLQPEATKSDPAEGGPTGLSKVEILAWLKNLNLDPLTMIPTAPDERIEWARVERVIPEETAAFVTLLEQHDLTLEDFCVDGEGYHIYDEDEEDKEVPEEVGTAWTKLQARFTEVTGLNLYYDAYEEMWSDGEEIHDYVTGFRVTGVWQLTDAGERFLSGKSRTTNEQQTFHRVRPAV
jgi:hypothetical protein